MPKTLVIDDVSGKGIPAAFYMAVALTGTKQEAGKAQVINRRLAPGP